LNLSDLKTVQIRAVSRAANSDLWASPWLSVIILKMTNPIAALTFACGKNRRWQGDETQSRSVLIEICRQAVAFVGVHGERAFAHLTAFRFCCAVGVLPCASSFEFLGEPRTFGFHC
jgi:hypothetical protein